jgi:hypothetical protein
MGHLKRFFFTFHDRWEIFVSLPFISFLNFLLKFFTILLLLLVWLVEEFCYNLIKAQPIKKIK